MKRSFFAFSFFAAALTVFILSCSKKDYTDNNLSGVFPPPKSDTPYGVTNGLVSDTPYGYKSPAGFLQTDTDVIEIIPAATADTPYGR
jgi:hypothetical protein